MSGKSKEEIDFIMKQWKSLTEEEKAMVEDPTLLFFTKGANLSKEMSVEKRPGQGEPLIDFEPDPELLEFFEGLERKHKEMEKEQEDDS